MGKQKTADEDWAKREEVFWDTVNSTSDIQPDR